MPPRGYVGVPAGRYCLLLARAYIIILYVGGVKLGVELNVKCGSNRGSKIGSLSRGERVGPPLFSGNVGCAGSVRGVLQGAADVLFVCILACE